MLTIVIQSGGESRRMGQDKALMPFLGRPLIQHLVDRLRPVAAEILVTTNHPGKYTFLDLPIIPDLNPGRGALGGLYTGLVAAKNPLVAVLACDMPFASPGLLHFQAELLQAEGADIAVPLLPDGYEPLHAVYRRATCLPAIEWALDNNIWKVIAWFPRVKVRPLTPDEIRPHDPLGLAFSNVNTPEEFALAEQRARALDRPLE